MLNITWNGEKIETSADSWGWDATLENYDPTPWDSETAAHGPHATLGRGVSERQAVADLIEQLLFLDA